MTAIVSDHELADATSSEQRIVLRNVRAVLLDRIVDDATIVCEQGVIVSVEERGAATPGAVDGRGAFCLPGLIDTHSDGLEKEVRPRPTSRFAEDFALRNFEGRLRAAGITTVFHGIGFEERPDHTRTIEQAEKSCAVIAERDESPMVPVDHRVLYRMEARSERGLAEAEAHFARPEHAHDGGAVLPLVSFEDHSPGQGQYRDIAKFAASIPEDAIPAGKTREEVVRERIDEAEAARAHRDQKLAGLIDHARMGRIRLLAHDCEDSGQVLDAHGHWGASVAEFPLTLEAARAAIGLGMATVMGAPNVLLGGSHSGNVSAEATVREGLCTGLASDYLPATLLAGAFELAERGAIGLPGAVSLVTAGPAEIAGLRDRGRLEPGMRADLALVELDGRWPTVRAVWRAHQPTI
ncbi:MAG: alpha-D-ribose 1-methylphosphonate 5-triphosphate diphosphatase [Acidimicrobiales bacterium]